MGLFEWLKSFISRDAIQCTRLPVSKENDLTNRSGVAAKADQHYVRLYFSELFLQKDREWFTTRFPLGYSLIAQKYGDQPKVEFANVAGKSKFDMPQAGQDRSVLRNYAMSPLLPFRGGDLEVDFGLVSMQAGNLLESFAKTVGAIAGKLSVPQASAVADMAATIAASIQELLGAGKAKTELYVHDMFTSQSLTSGYVLLASNPLESFKGKTLWMTDDGIRVGPNKDALAPVDPQDFLVVLVECLDERDDWQSLSAIGKPLDGAVQAKLSGKDDEAKLLLVQSKVAAIASPDLTRRDARRVVAAIDAYYKNDGALEAAQSMESPAGAPPQHLALAMERFPASQAANLPEISFESLF